MNREFKPTHRLVDSEGGDNEPVMLVRGRYADQQAWEEGGRYVSLEELAAIGWSVRAIRAGEA